MNYRYFLRKLEEYLLDFLDIFAYCLIPNHFHLLVRIKKPVKMPSFGKMASLSNEVDINSVISEQFRKFFIAYSMAINKQERRIGSLFQKPFKRKAIDEEDYLINSLCYIHLNPVHHGICDQFQDYSWSFYRTVLSNNKTSVQRRAVLELFQGRAYFIEAHQFALMGLYETETFLFE